MAILIFESAELFFTRSSIKGAGETEVVASFPTEILKQEI